MLWLALTVRDTGIAASERFRIEDEVVAFGLDLAVSQRLFRHDIEIESHNKKWWSKMLTGEDDDA